MLKYLPLDFIGLRETMKKDYDLSFFLENLTLVMITFGSGFPRLGNLVVFCVV
jgi:hypothetical protein